MRDVCAQDACIGSWLCQRDIHPKSRPFKDCTLNHIAIIWTFFNCNFLNCSVSRMYTPIDSVECIFSFTHRNSLFVSMCRIQVYSFPSPVLFQIISIITLQVVCKLLVSRSGLSGKDRFIPLKCRVFGMLLWL